MSQPVEQLVRWARQIIKSSQSSDPTLRQDNQFLKQMRQYQEFLSVLGLEDDILTGYDTAQVQYFQLSAELQSVLHESLKSSLENIIRKTSIDLCLEFVRYVYENTKVLDSIILQVAPAAILRDLEVLAQTYQDEPLYKLILIRYFMLAPQNSFDAIKRLCDLSVFSCSQLILINMCSFFTPQNEITLSFTEEQLRQIDPQVLHFQQLMKCVFQVDVNPARDIGELQTAVDTVCRAPSDSKQKRQQLISCQYHSILANDSVTNITKQQLIQFIFQQCAHDCELVQCFLTTGISLKVPCQKQIIHFVFQSLCECLQRCGGETAANAIASMIGSALGLAEATYADGTEYEIKYDLSVFEQPFKAALDCLRPPQQQLLATSVIRSFSPHLQYEYGCLGIGELIVNVLKNNTVYLQEIRGDLGQYILTTSSMQNLNPTLLEYYVSHCFNADTVCRAFDSSTESQKIDLAEILRASLLESLFSGEQEQLEEKAQCYSYCMNDGSFDECSSGPNKYQIQQIIQLVTQSLSPNIAAALAFVVSGYKISEISQYEDSCRQLLSSTKRVVKKILPIMYMFGNFKELDTEYLRTLHLTYDSVQSLLSYDDTLLLSMYPRFSAQQREFIIRYVLQSKQFRTLNDIFDQQDCNGEIVHDIQRQYIQLCNGTAQTIYSNTTNIQIFVKNPVSVQMELNLSALRDCVSIFQLRRHFEDILQVKANSRDGKISVCVIVDGVEKCSLQTLGPTVKIGFSMKENQFQLQCNDQSIKQKCSTPQNYVYSLQLFSDVQRYEVLCSRLSVDGANMLPQVAGLRFDYEEIRKFVCQEISCKKRILENLQFALHCNVSRFEVFWGFDFVNIVRWLEAEHEEATLESFAQYAGEQQANQLLNSYLLNAFQLLKDTTLARSCCSKLLKNISDPHMSFQKCIKTTVPWNGEQRTVLLSTFLAFIQENTPEWYQDIRYFDNERVYVGNSYIEITFQNLLASKAQSRLTSSKQEFEIDVSNLYKQAVEEEIEHTRPSAALLQIYLQINNENLEQMFSMLNSRLAEIRNQISKQLCSEENYQLLLNAIFRLYILAPATHMHSIDSLISYPNRSPLSSQNICAFVYLLWRFGYGELMDWFRQQRLQRRFKTFIRYVAHMILESESAQKRVSSSGALNESQRQRVGKAVIEFLIRHFKYDERYIALYITMVEYLDEDVCSDVITQDTHVIKQQFISHMICAAQQAGCTPQGRQCIKQIIIHQCVLRDQGPYENSLVSQIVAQARNDMLCREIAIEMAEQSACRSTEIIKMCLAKNIYLNVYDDFTQSLMDALLSQNNHPRTDMTVCGIVLYKILTCDCGERIDVFKKALQSKLGNFKQSYVNQYPILELFQQLLLSDSPSYRLQLAAEAHLLYQKITGCKQLSISIKCQSRQFKNKNIKNSCDIQSFIRDLGELRYPIEAEINSKSYVINSIDRSVVDIMLNFFDSVDIFVENTHVDQLKLIVNRFVNSVMEE